MVCHLPGHWVTCRVDFETSSITVYDSFQKEWTDETMHEMRLRFTPLLRVLPQVLKFTKFYELHNSLNASHAKYTEWQLKFPEGEPAFRQDDSSSCGPFSLMYVESLLTGHLAPKVTKKDLQKYRSKIAENIFMFSTSKDTIPILNL